MFKKKNMYLFEQDVDIESNLDFTEKAKSRKSKISVDSQIDALILMYEKVAIRDEQSIIQESLDKQNLSALLFEQEEEAADETADDPLADATGGEDDGGETPEPTGAEESQASEPAKDLIPDLDIDNFTKKVARLTMNHRSLLTVEQVILNRAKNFLDENYGDSFAKRFLESLDEQFGIEFEEFNQNDTEQPFAVGANSAGAGGS